MYYFCDSVVADSRAVGRRQEPSCLQWLRAAPRSFVPTTHCWNVGRVSQVELEVLGRRIVRRAPIPCRKEWRVRGFVGRFVSICDLRQGRQC